MTTIKSAERIARETMAKHYGPGSDWAEPNAYDEAGFIRAQAESDIDAEEITAIIREAVEADRAQRAKAVVDERFADPVQAHNLYGLNLHGSRVNGAKTVILEATGRTNDADRREAAAKLATITESFTITTLQPRRKWLVRYETTHRIVPQHALEEIVDG